MHEYETEIEVAGDTVDAVVEYEWDDIVTGDRVTGAYAIVTGVYLLDDGHRIEITGCLSRDTLDELAPEEEASPATRRQWARNRSAALYGEP